MLGQLRVSSQLLLPISLSILLNSGIVEGHMDLDPADAKLGHRFHINHAHDDPHQLSNKQQLCKALEHVHNLVSNDEAYIGNSDQDATTLSFAAKFYELKNKLDCSLGEATYDNPPKTAALIMSKKVSSIFHNSLTSMYEMSDHIPIKRPSLSSLKKLKAPEHWVLKPQVSYTYWQTIQWYLKHHLMSSSAIESLYGSTRLPADRNHGYAKHTEFLQLSGGFFGYIPPSSPEEDPSHPTTSTASRPDHHPSPITINSVIQTNTND
ncbi:hypothetical protein C8R48DRAFT_670405 [Suillus tomentosus]|nr:hypothetical protein C8R48DRAFT_670405 [Suillus tomentosus]